MSKKITQLTKAIGKVMGLAIATLPVSQTFAQSSSNDNSSFESSSIPNNIFSVI